MIGETLLSIFLLIIISVLVSSIISDYKDEYKCTSETVFTALVKTVLTVVVAFAVSFIVPTSVTSEVLQPTEYEVAKNDESVVFIHKDDYLYKNGIYYHQYAKDSTKLELKKAYWKNVVSDTVGTTLYAFKK